MHVIVSQGQTEYYAGELQLNAKLRVFAVNCSLLYGGHNMVHAQLHVKSKRGTCNVIELINPFTADPVSTVIRHE